MNDKICFLSVCSPGNLSFVPCWQTSFNPALPGCRRLRLCCDRAGLQKSLLFCSVVWLRLYYSVVGVPGEIHPSEAASPRPPTSPHSYSECRCLALFSFCLVPPATTAPKTPKLSSVCHRSARVFHHVDVTRCWSIVGCEAYSNVFNNVIMQ